MSSTSDAQARIEALDPTRSFIVQAPAGSGKTSLLTQRFLTLLGGVSAPEEILAITFTKKAAGEMRERIISALAMARSTPRPDDAHLAHTWDLAQGALERNDKMAWHLQENPARLRVLTIDSLCAKLAAGLPILSQFGASPSPTEDASQAYNEAARRTLDAIHQHDLPHRDSVGHLLLHLDNDLLRVQQQIADMLARRDKWMRPLIRIFGDLREAGDEALRGALQGALHQVIVYHLELLHRQLGPQQRHALKELATFAAGNLPEGGPFACWLDTESRSLDPTPQSLVRWQSFANLLLTSKGTWRKSVTKKVGFPAEGDARSLEQRSEFKAAKARFKALIAELGEQPALRQYLLDVKNLPPASYSDNQWETLRALLEVSRLAAAQLTLVFRDTSTTDFVEVAHRAERALGTDEEPTDLAMALDGKLQHLLVDEFQDTSLGQLELLCRLTAEWIPGEGRTLFLVGDPMQSIYRFRDAEVGLFLQVREHGLGHLHPESLTLRANFRSQGGLVDWFNDSFSQVFPAVDNPTVGSVSYSQAQAAHPTLAGAPVEYWSVISGEEREENQQAEAEVVVRIVEQARTEDPNGTIAILTRSRGHLKALLPLLKDRGHRFQGVDLEPLSTRPWIRDLLSLTQAIFHSGDRLAWLSILRAPWCGLSSSDLFHISEANHYRTIPRGLERYTEIENLSEDGRTRLDRVWPVLSDALKERRRRPFRESVEAVWLALGGPAGLPTATALTDCHTFLNLIAEIGASSTSDPLSLLVEKMDRLFAQPDVTADGSLQIMTIHKSKGLEFDTVIVPGLGNPPRRSEEPLVSWLEWSGSGGDSQLLLAPITERGRDRDPVYEFVHSLEKKKEENESARLLYVAATRAKKRLHLVGLVEQDPKQDDGVFRTPRNGSFLKLLWPALSHQFYGGVRRVDLTESEQSPQAEVNLDITRLTSRWVPPTLPPDLEAQKADILDEEEMGDHLKFEWASETVKHVGTVVHRVLQQVGREGMEEWTQQRLESLHNYLQSRLAAMGVPGEALFPAVERSLRALKESLTSQRGRWILDSEHQHARSEFAISGVWNGRLVRSVVDRTFVDETGTRWIVDFKTGSHLGGSEDKFLDKQVERYKPQLRRYGQLMQKLDDRPIRVGLYFPLLKAWREWSLEESLPTPEQLEFSFD